MTEIPNPVRQATAQGQSIWLDDIRRNMIESGELAALINRDGLAGITSNPAIFREAITRHDDYAAQIELFAAQGARADAIYEALILEDIAHAADVFRPLYEETGGADGYVSLEVSPHLARNTERTLDEARRLASTLNRPNVMIKVPGTREGLPAIRQLISEGMNVNVTLLFSVGRYAEVLEAYLAGLAERAAAGLPVKVASVASFFLGRIDVMIDPQIDRLGTPAAHLRGEAAIACARLAYQHFNEVLASQRWQRLAEMGAAPQRPLWASTGTKDPTYSDVKYVEALIGPLTVATLPRATYDAFRDHGKAQPRLEQDLDLAKHVLTALAAFGIDLDEVAEVLEVEGIRKFVEPFDALLDALRRHERAA